MTPKRFEKALGVRRCFAIHAAMVASIPPDEIAKGLASMLPADEHRRPSRDARKHATAPPAEAFRRPGLADSVVPPPSTPSSALPGPVLTYRSDVSEVSAARRAVTR